ncbi:hypothetical protein MAR_010904, partial [Mya arenaria]
FDGASTISGLVTGVQARITNLFPKAKYFTHCNPLSKLVIVPSCTEVPEIRNFMNAFKELTLFFGYSAKRKDKLKTFLTKDMSDLLAVHVEICSPAVFQPSVSIAASFEDVPSDPRTVGRQRHRADSSSDKARAQDYYRLNNNFPFLDHMISP